MLFSHNSRFRFAVGVSSLILLGIAFLAPGCSPEAKKNVAAVKEKPPEKIVPGDLLIFPTNALLITARASQSFVAQLVQPDGVTRDVTAEAKFSIKDSKVADMNQNVARPIADGETTLTVQFSNKKVELPVVVQKAGTHPDLSFRLDVEPVFMKAGCNSGNCHGSSRGKDGFRLSLFGFDPDGDYFRLTREQIGRRINLGMPEESLLLEKGLGKVPHTGGERFTTNSPLYGTIREWLVTGAAKDTTNVAQVVGLEVYPKHVVLEGEKGTQRMTVRAKYSDGSVRDVTSLAVFISNNDVSANVSDAGVITSGQRGEAFVMARFSTFTVGSPVVVVPKETAKPFPAVPENNYVDNLVYAKLKKLRYEPSGLCDDSTFVRRVYLDMVGLLPRPEELRDFSRDNDPEKRNKLIDKLLERKEFTDLWAMKWAEMLQIRSNNDQFSYKGAYLYYSWLKKEIAQKVPLDQMVHEIITASGPTFENPPANYYQIERDTLKTSENVAQVFLGMRVQCSQCHNHPFDRWTMDDYYSFAAFFPQVGRKTAEDPREMVIFDNTGGEVKHPVGGRNMKPKFLGGEIAEIKERSRREVLADWLTSKENKYFANHMGNLMWAHFFGKGIIDPVDDVRVSNPASNPELLDALGEKLVEYKYDFRKLVRDICQSRTYQLSSAANETNAMDDRNFSRAGIRRIRAEVLFDCISQVTETSERFIGLPKGAHAVEIADGNINNYFLTTFGRATRTTVCTCEVKTEPNLSQALHLLNGNTTQDKCVSGGVVKNLLKQKKSNDEVIEDLYLRCLSRPPTEVEKKKLEKFFSDDKKPEGVLNDLFWALLNSKEFIFNH